MFYLKVSLLLLLRIYWSRADNLKFPASFKFGVGSAAYQIEGGWNADGKGVSFWDDLLHKNPELIADGSNGDVACDSYHKWEDDIKILKELGVNHYRFSLAWTRILPGGFVNDVNQAGLDYYNNLIDALIANDIEPIVTIYHWDQPASFNILGTWTNEESVDAFTDLAGLAFKHFGDRVKTWITFNEPYTFCVLEASIFSQFEPYPTGIAEYLCSQNVIKAHAKAYHLYKDQFKVTQNGRVGITIIFAWYLPATQSTADIAAAEQRRQFGYGIYLNPLFNFGWPKIVESRVANRSKLEGFSKSRLPEYSLADKIYIHGSFDFLAVNHYTSQLVSASPDAPIGQPTFFNDQGTTAFFNSSWPTTADANFVVYPPGMRQLLNWLKNNYGNPPMIITECGYGDNTGTLDDLSTRGSFFKEYLTTTLQAVVEDDCNVSGFTSWSLMDSFEWTSGFTIYWSKASNLTFPASFKFGVATSAYQIEGGWNEDGKGISFWDDLLHTNPGLTPDGSNGNVACDSYHKWQDDIRILKELGVNHYRFSLAWTRILPGGFVNHINQAGLDYYNNLIDALIANDIEPVVTIYYWDEPASFGILGTWTNEKSIDAYTHFAGLAFKHFGDRVKTWITFNEPWSFCVDHAILFSQFEPYPTGIAEYLCSQNVMKAHAKAYHLYRDQFKATQNGRVGITLLCEWYLPATQSAADIAAAEQRRQFDYGIYLNPLFNFGWPKIVDTRVANRSRLEGFPESRLPEYSLADKIYIHGSIDFLGVNHYTSQLVSASPDAPIGQPTFLNDEGGTAFFNSSWPKTGVAAFAEYPQGIRQLLNWLKKNYGNPTVLITECGYADQTGTLDDLSTRGSFFKGYLTAILQAVVEDHCNVFGFTSWSLMDDFEWTSGFTTKLGFYQVNFTDPNRPRVAKDSARYYTSVIQTRLV